MPAQSESQQRLMAMVHAYKAGKLNTKDMDDSLLAKIKKIAKGISSKDAKDFAETSHKGIPDRVTENTMTFKDYLLLEYIYEYEALMLKYEDLGLVDKTMESLIKMYTAAAKRKEDVDDILRDMSDRIRQLEHEDHV